MDGKTVALADFGQNFLVPTLVAGDSGPRLHRAFGQRQFVIGDNEPGVHLHSNTEAGTARAGAVGAVEAEAPNVERRKQPATARAEPDGRIEFVMIPKSKTDQTVTQIFGYLHRFHRIFFFN